MVFVLLSSSLSSSLLRFPDFLGLYSHTGSFKALKNKVRETVRLDNLKGGACVPELFIRFLKIEDLVDQSNKERTKIIPSIKTELAVVTLSVLIIRSSKKHGD